MYAVQVSQLTSPHPSKTSSAMASGDVYVPSSHEYFGMGCLYYGLWPDNFQLSTWKERFGNTHHNDRGSSTTKRYNSK